MKKMALLMLMGMTLTGCLLTVDSDGRLLDNTWDEGDVNRLSIGNSDTEWVRTTFRGALEPHQLRRWQCGMEISQPIGKRH